MTKSVLIACSALAMATIPAFAQEAATPRKHQKWGVNLPDWTQNVPNFKAVAPNEHPRLVFRQTDLDTLKKRAATPEGKIIIERMNKILEGPFTLWHPAGYGLLYQITGEMQYADKARQLTEDILDKGVKDKDGRYGFANPGSGGPMRSGPAIGAMGLAYDLNHKAWPEDFRKKVAKAILDNPYTNSIAARGPIGPGCNHYGAAVGGVGVGLLAIQNDDGVDQKKVEELLEKIVKQARDEIAEGYGDRGYYFEGHHCGRISSNSGLIPFIASYRIAAGKDLVSKNENARWLAAKWIYDFALNNDGKYTNAQRGMYARNFPRGGMTSMNGDFAQGFAITPREFLPALKWVYNNQVEPSATKTFDIVEYPQQAIYSLAHWPFDVQEKNPQDQPDLFPRVMYDTAAGYIVFRNGWSAKPGEDIVVTALLGTAPTNGRGMAAGGSVYVLGKGLGWSEPFTNYRFPGIFHCSYPTYTKFEKDGSGVVSAIGYEEKVHGKLGEAPAAYRDQYSKKPTCLAVDFSGKSGAPLLVAMTGPGIDYQVEYWMQIVPSKFKDVKGADGFATRTLEVKFGDDKGYIMTLQKGDAPAVTNTNGTVTIGTRKLSFDGKKLIMD